MMFGEHLPDPHARQDGGDPGQRADKARWSPDLLTGCGAPDACGLRCFKNG
jgi:hypothetical protein